MLAASLSARALDSFVKNSVSIESAGQSTWREIIGETPQIHHTILL